ncbi:hypothetical protein BGZ61DRAFT_441576 [Ilyonectria robusta]|uniref:uncharacterized protein n=1 Tax=Ilyonectria robusta TaxID=1079257 RepID=UPI001E8D80FC|nr:uncharacterized protein BGZ61DRAFT_441576 [Ilyonectria robusta]KAH8736109.1 hypothetical protein BGZ61DRAFT_441576 [Ilyonectria robusta]
MQFKFLFIVAAATAVLAAPLLMIPDLGLAAIADDWPMNSLNQIRIAAIHFNKTVAEWNGGYLGAISIVMQSRELVNTIGAASASIAPSIVARTSNAISLDQDALEIALHLVRDVGSAIDTAIDAKPKHDALPTLSKPIVVNIFKNLRTAASELGGVLGPLTTGERVGEAHTIVKQIDDHLVRGLAVYA